ncbi:cytochrome C [Marinicauda algicola]|uniref:Cytochrome C n=1 Tax=Marinicauda algicola TaxID=2029849 RepID=A0A4S2H4R6_9PROT|nr:cytochrome c3 family protein [Marinicauda algicola]TGY90616.1 cytochrome C [Marinicauda algicola]
MAQIFQRTADAWLRLFLTGLAIAIPGIFLLLAILAVNPTQYGAALGFAPQQPVAFSHRHHAGELGISCVNCHVSAERAASAGFPPIETCMACHSQIWTNAEELEPVREAFLAGEPIAWTRVHDLPDFVYFDHGVHVQAGVACASCHGDVTQMPLLQKAEPMTMRFCLDCHRDPAPNLVAREAVYDPHPHSDEYERLSLFMASARVQNPEALDNCNACHR